MNISCEDALNTVLHQAIITIKCNMLKLEKVFFNIWKTKGTHVLHEARSEKKAPATFVSSETCKVGRAKLEGQKR